MLLSLMPCSSISSLRNSESMYCTVRMTCTLILKCENLTRASFITNSLYKCNRIGAKQHSYLTPVRIFPLFVSPCSSGILTLLSVCNFLINLLPVYETRTQFPICVQSTFDSVLGVPLLSIVPSSLLNH
jgi:hypothetical protein